MRTFVVALLMMPTLALAADPFNNAFDHVFSALGEPTSIHFVANYHGKSGAHRLELWRDGQRRVRRKTDEHSDAYIQHHGQEEDWSMVILDHRKKQSVSLDRASLMQFGQFTDWFDLAHGLIRPFGPHDVNSIPAPPELIDKPITPCRWYALTMAKSRVHVCWSVNDHLPILMSAPQATRAHWVITALDRDPIPDAVFLVDRRGYKDHALSQDLLED